jgi:hypothetical protein
MIRLVDHDRVPPKDRLTRVVRVLLIAELLAPLRRGATIQELCADVSDSLGHRYCERTIMRDVDLLESLGIVEKDRLRVYWNGDSARASIVERMAACACEYRDN